MSTEKDPKLYELKEASEYVKLVLLMNMFYYLHRRAKRVICNIVGVFHKMKVLMTPNYLAVIAK